ncbi:alpha/beta hydrolase [Enterococcus devriesei]|uniref:alpha/beta hydrolase n=1 Tax=Enterococcus devriesei TaxID=319970 RepID=UPI00288F2749|nr:alpha/beta hydrolase [Enterococcus devriesei]MDT2822690.1 alpha/beta hydrolase [Enterococcus devriesei]
MEKAKDMIEGIPILRWGETSDKIVLAFHGDQSHKEDTVIQLLAEAAVPKGYQVWSFDLPEHGERKGQPYALNPPNVVADVEKILFKHQQAQQITLFGCSIGAYFAMLAGQAKNIQQSLFLSPIVDMRELIENILDWSRLTPADLRREKRIKTPFNTLAWEYYCYVVEHPIQWTVSTKILYGGKDQLTSRKTIEKFARPSMIDLTIFETGEHFFHTPTQLSFYQQWLTSNL